MTDIENKIWNIITDTVEDLDHRLVRVRVTGSENIVLQIMIEPNECTPEAPVATTIDNCAKVSRAVAAILDVEDPITNAYNLEVSSTGIERPLVLEKDFELYAGKPAYVVTGKAVNGQRKFKGTLLGIKEGEIEFKITDGETVAIPFKSVKNANLVF